MKIRKNFVIETRAFNPDKGYKVCSVWAECKGYFALHFLPNSDRLTITHIPSGFNVTKGFKICDKFSLKQWRKLLDILNSSDLDWKFGINVPTIAHEKFLKDSMVQASE